MSEHRVKVDGGKYEFVCEGFGAIDILRHGRPWVSQTQASNALHAIMCELDAARVVVHAARAVKDGALPFAIIAALEQHDRLTSDREPPSPWCGVEAKAPTQGPVKCPRCWFTPCRKMFQCREHWPDCAVNHGGTECDMGPECGQPVPRTK